MTRLLHHIDLHGLHRHKRNSLIPLLKNQNSLEDYEVLEISQNQFDMFQISDEFSMINYLSEEDILTVIFLDNLSNYFISKG